MTCPLLVAGNGGDASVTRRTALSAMRKVPYFEGLVESPKTIHGVSHLRYVSVFEQGRILRKSRFTDGQIIRALREAEDGRPISDICRALGVADGTFTAGDRRVSRQVRIMAEAWLFTHGGSFCYLQNGHHEWLFS